MMAQIGVITEQNDLGLGFDPLTDEETKTIQESTETGKKKEEAK